MVTNLKQFMATYSDETVCREHLIKQRWPDGNVTCQYCGHKKCYRIDKGERFKCANNKCYKRFRVTVGTIFEASNVPLSTWFAAQYLIMNHKKGISSCQLARDLGVTQKTAWFMLHRIREQLRANNSPLLSGTVEIDETFVGGIVGNMSKKRRAALRTENGGTIQNKTMVVGMLQRGGELRLTAMGRETGSHVLQPLVRNNIDRKANLITDSSLNYEGLSKQYLSHEVVNHSNQEYVREDNKSIHTNSIEGAFGLLKRSIIGIYHHVTPKHLGRYCDETAFRYNTRKVTDPQRFDLSLMNIEGRLTYKQLTYEPEIVPVEFKEQITMYGIGKARPVYQIKDGRIVNEYPSISEAARRTGLKQPAISLVLKGRQKTTGGFEWKYA